MGVSGRIEKFRKSVLLVFVPFFSTVSNWCLFSERTKEINVLHARVFIQYDRKYARVKVQVQ